MLNAITRISVSLALIIMDLLPSSVAGLACTKMRLSASSWKHLSRRSRQVSDVLKISGHLNNLVSKKVEEVCFVIIMSQEIAPI